jgi:hypothetical protein
MLELVLLCAWIEAVAIRLRRTSGNERSVRDAQPAASAATS